MGYWCLKCDNSIANNFDYENKLCKRCGSHNIIEFPDDMTMGDIITLEDISKDALFLQTMLELRENDPIEFQLKMSQFKANLAQQRVEPHDNISRCPTCNSTNIKKISVSTKVTNIALFGLFGNKRKKIFHCNNCGYEW